MCPVTISRHRLEMPDSELRMLQEQHLKSFYLFFQPCDLVVLKLFSKDLWEQ